MGSILVVPASIVLHDDAGFGDGKEDFLIETLVSEAAMKTLDKSILPRAARLNVKRLNIRCLTPILNDLGDKFRAIIRANKRRRALRRGQGFERIQDLVTGDRTCRMNDQTLTGIFIHHRQHLHGPTIGGPIHNEIPRPDVARIGRLHWIAHRRSAAPFQLTHRWHAQAFLPTHSLDPFAIVLDEPTASIDAVSEVELYNRFQEVAHDKTTIFVSHRLGWARFAERILVFHQGQLVEDGVHDESMQRGEAGIYASAFYAQAAWYDD